MYQKVRKLDTSHNEQACNLLKQTIIEGNGPYAALAVKLMCDHIDGNRNMFGWDMSTPLGTVLKNKEKYLSIAREKNPLIGNYLTTNTYMDLMTEMGGGGVVYMFSDNEVYSRMKELLKFYYLMRHFIDEDPSSYSILTNELKQDLIQDVSKAKMVSLDDHEKQKLLLSITTNKLQKFKNPLNDINKKMDVFNIPTSGPFADEARIIAQLEIEKLISMGSLNRLS
jgi:hypothetical protein